MASTIHPDIPDHATVRDAFQRLSPEATPGWGTLDAAAMLEHCARFNELYLGRRSAPLAVRVLARLFSGFAVRKFTSSSPFEMQHGMKTLSAIRVEPSAVDPDAFEATRTRLLATLDELDAIGGTWAHPLYGSIDAEAGKAMARSHAAHHLRQFGLL
jgi:hypothetical protein